jgi:hypothetical protein
MVAKTKSGAQAVKGKRVEAERKATAKPRQVANAEGAVTINRRENGDRRTAPDSRVREVPVAVDRRTLQRRVKVNRRRQIDPTTCERDYTSAEIEFMNAMDEYKRRNGRMFPTCSEVLEVVKLLGYEKRPRTESLLPPSLEVPAAASAEMTV